MKGASFYTDGGKRQDLVGWGLHGFTYAIDGKEVKPKNTDQPTEMGYLDKVQKFERFKNTGKRDTMETVSYDLLKPGSSSTELNSKLYTDPVKKVASLLEGATIQPVKVEKYVDGWGKLKPEDTNNTAEIVALNQALTYAIDNEISRLKIISDSQYAILCSSLIDSYETKGWTNSKGEQMANLDIWKDIAKNIKQLVNDGKEVQFVWVKGHSGELGNELADTNATKGLIGNTEKHLKETDASKYGKTELDYNRLLSFPIWYFKTNDDCFKRPDGTYQYIVGNHDNKMEMAGKRAIDHTYAVVRLDAENEVFRKVYDAQTAKLNCTAKDIVFANMNTLFNNRVLCEIEEHGFEYAYPTKTESLVLFDKPESGGITLTEVIRPQRIANRVYDYAELINYVLDSYLANDPSIVVTDITDKIQKVEKGAKDKLKYSLTDPVKSNLTLVKVKANYDLGKKGVKEFNLAIGFDMPNRNCLSRLIGENFSVHLLTWKEANIAFRYAVVVRTEGGIAIYASHSNCVIVDEV